MESGEHEVKAFVRVRGMYVPSIESARSNTLPSSVHPFPEQALPALHFSVPNPSSAKGDKQRRTLNNGSAAADTSTRWKGYYDGETSLYPGTREEYTRHCSCSYISICVCGLVWGALLELIFVERGEMVVCESHVCRLFMCVWTRLFVLLLRYSCLTAFQLGRILRRLKRVVCSLTMIAC